MINTEFAKYYARLYSQSLELHTPDMLAYVNTTTLHKLNEVQRAKLGEPITANEIQVTIEVLAKGKTPETDGAYRQQLVPKLLI